MFRLREEQPHVGVFVGIYCITEICSVWQENPDYEGDLIYTTEKGHNSQPPLWGVTSLNLKTDVHVSFPPHLESLCIDYLCDPCVNVRSGKKRRLLPYVAQVYVTATYSPPFSVRHNSCMTNTPASNVNLLDDDAFHVLVKLQYRNSPWSENTSETDLSSAVQSRQ